MPKVLLVEAQAPLGPRGRHAQGAHCQALIEQAGVSAHVRQLENGQVLGVNGRVVHWPQNVRASLAAQLALLPPHHGAAAVLALRRGLRRCNDSTSSRRAQACVIIRGSFLGDMCLRANRPPLQHCGAGACAHPCAAGRHAQGPEQPQQQQSVQRAHLLQLRALALR